MHKSLLIIKRNIETAAAATFTSMQPVHFAIAICAVLIAAIVCASVPSHAFADVRKADVIFDESVESRDLSISECPSIEAEYAALISDDGRVLFSRSGDGPSQIASITKVMTAIVALDNAPSDIYIGVSEAAASVGESTAGLQAGDVMDLDSALKALLVPSGNDAAVAIAESVGSAMIASNPSLGSDPTEVFVNAMNDKARELGCTDTVYENTHGLDDGEFEGNLHSTALDQTKVAKCAMQYPKIAEIVSGGSTTISVTREGGKAEVELETTDLLLEMYEYAIGIKTGLTNLAGPSFMGAAEKDGERLYAIVLGSSDEYQRFDDAETLFEWAYKHVKEIALVNSEVTSPMKLGSQTSNVPVFAVIAHQDWIDKTVPVTLSNPYQEIEIFDLEGNVSQSVTLNDVHGNVDEGDHLGHVVFKQKNKVVAEYDLIACQAVPAPNPFEAIGIWWQRLVGGFGGNDAHAQSEVYNVMPIISNNKTNAA